MVTIHSSDIREGEGKTVRNVYASLGGGTRKRRIYFYRTVLPVENETHGARWIDGPAPQRRHQSLPKYKLQFDESTNGFALYLRPNTGVVRAI